VSTTGTLHARCPRLLFAHFFLRANKYYRH
jgi:hypothetical protein